MQRRSFLAALAGAAVGPAATPDRNIKAFLALAPKTPWIAVPSGMEPDMVISMEVATVLLTPGDIVTFGGDPLRYVITAVAESQIDFEPATDSSLT